MREACKITVATYALTAISLFIEAAILVLYAYMTVQFCNPLDGKWQQFLVGYREKSLDAYLCRASRDEKERARRYHEASVRDANAQIMLLKAMVAQSQELPDEEDCS